jgi:hypothetical protein
MRRQVSTSKIRLLIATDASMRTMPSSLCASHRRGPSPRKPNAGISAQPPASHVGCTRYSWTPGPAQVSKCRWKAANSDGCAHSRRAHHALLHVRLAKLLCLYHANHAKAGYRRAALRLAYLSPNKHLVFHSQLCAYRGLSSSKRDGRPARTIPSSLCSLQKRGRPSLMKL